MGKVSVDDKLRIQTLREQGLGYRAIATKYPEKNWNLDTEHFEHVLKLWHSEMSNFHVSFDFNISTIMKIVISIVIVLRGSVVA